MKLKAQNLSLILIQFAFLSIFYSKLYAQYTSTEFEIESILVDGCAGSDEGKNEMVLFRNGPSNLDINNIRIDGAGATGIIQTSAWPNTGNPFLGFCTSAGATANVALLNADIVQCGKLIEPIGGIIPANGKVLIITSTDFTAIPSYFSNLVDTLYVVFQCAGNTAGHFVNYNSVASSRTLVLTNMISGYADTIYYDRSLLLNSLSIPGADDGGAVSYTFSGVPTYFNNGCQAPFIPLSTNIDPVGNIDCSTNSYLLNGNVLAGNYKSIFWDGGTGTFSSPLTNSTTYTPGNGELGNISLRFNAVGFCNDTIRSTVNLTIYPIPSSFAGNDTSLCSTVPGSIGTSPTNGFSYSWNSAVGLSSNSIANPTITLTNNTLNATISTYIVTTTVNGTGCSLNDTVEITTNPLDNPSFTLTPTCDGATSLILGLSGGSFNFTSLPTDAATINFNTGTISNGSPNTNYTVTYTSNGVCPNSSSESITSLVADNPSFSITATCDGGNSIITGTSGGTFTFNTLPIDGAQINSVTGQITNGTYGNNYSVLYSTNGTCPSSSIEIVTALMQDNADFTTTATCSGATSIINGTTGGTFSFTTTPNFSGNINSSTGELTNGLSDSTYSIIYITNGACPNSSINTITILTTPNLPAIISTTNQLCSFDEFPFIKAIGQNGEVFNWYSDLNLSNHLATSDSIQALNQIGNTTYYVTATLNTCTSLPSEITVTVNNCAINIPTAFTPDNDLVNDQWVLENIDISYPNNVVKIYNRWGNLIFESSKGKYESKPWDGKFNNDEMPTGSYYFIIEFNDSSKQNENGTVTIIKK